MDLCTLGSGEECLRKKKSIIKDHRSGSCLENSWNLKKSRGASLVAQVVKNPPWFRRPRLDSWVRKIPWKRDRLHTLVFLNFSGGSHGKTSTCNGGDLASVPRVEEGMATHSSILAWTVIPMDKGAWQPTVHGSQRVRHDWVTKHIHRSERNLLGKQESGLR